MYAPTAYTADDDTSRSSRANLQTGTILHLPRERRDQNPGRVRCKHQADPRMLDAHQAVPTGALRPTESRAFPQDPNGKGRGNRGRLLYGCNTWTLRQEHYAKLRIGAQHKSPDHRMTSYNRPLEITRCESIETTLRTRRLLRAGTLIRMSGGRLSKRIIFGNLEGAVRRGRGGKEKEWTDCVQSDIRAFGITVDWKAMSLKGEVWVEAVTEGGQRSMTAWKK